MATGKPFTSKQNRSVEILICIEGKAVVKAAADGPDLGLVKGNSILIPAAVPEYSLKGEATFYRADVPI